MGILESKALALGEFPDGHYIVILDYEMKLYSFLILLNVQVFTNRKFALLTSSVVM